jgi:hypothetical protein
VHLHLLQILSVRPLDESDMRLHGETFFLASEEKLPVGVELGISLLVRLMR